MNISIPILKTASYVLSSFLLLMACHQPPVTSNDNQSTNDVDKLLAGHFKGEAYQVKWNRSRTYLLAIKSLQKENKIRTPQTLHFVVIEKSTNTIAYENRVMDGKVSWYDDTNLKISGYQEQIDGPHDRGNVYLYDLKQKRVIQYPKEKL